MTHLPRIKARLELHAHRRVRGLLEGDYASVHVGRSLDFNDLREYVPGDDVRDLDWKASARSGHLLVRRYVATRKHTLLLAVSTGRSMAAADERGAPKRELATFLAGALGWLALRHGDLVGTAYGDAGGVQLLRASDKEVALERALAAVHDAATADAAPGDVAALLEHVARTVRRRTILAVVTDEPVLDDRALDALRRARVQHEVLLLTVGDLDPTLATGSLLDVDTGAAVPEWAQGDRRLAAEYAAAVATETRTLRTQLDRLGIAQERVPHLDAAVPALHRLLHRHRHGRRD